MQKAHKEMKILMEREKACMEKKCMLTNPQCKHEKFMKGIHQRQSKQRNAQMMPELFKRCEQNGYTYKKRLFYCPGFFGASPNFKSQNKI